jgi:hypothetical protein
MVEYQWMVWKDCRLVGYVMAYSERDALIKAQNKYGERLFVERPFSQETVLTSR